MKKFKIFIILLIAISAICIFLKIFVNNNDDIKNTLNNTSDVPTNTPEIEEPVLSEVQKANEQRKTCSEITTKRNLPVLMYHFFYDKQAGEKGKDNNYMEIQDFEEQVKYLAENNYYVPSWQEVEDFVNGKIGLPEKSIIITVDDGDESFFRLAVPVLEKYNFPATSFVITSWYNDTLKNYASPAVDFQSHSNDMHKAGSNGKGAFLTLNYEDACKDLEASKNCIGDNCKVFCYPFGHYNDKAEKTLKDCNYTMSFTTKYGYVTPGMNLYELPRIRMSKGETLKAFINKVK